MEEKILLDRSIDPTGDVELRSNSRKVATLWNTKKDAPYCEHMFDKAEIIHWLENKHPHEEGLCPHCVGRQILRVKDSSIVKREPIILGDYFVVKTEDYIQWVYEIMSFEGAPGNEIKIKSSVTGIWTYGQIGGGLLREIEVIYDNGWKAIILDEDYEPVNTLDAVYVKTSEYSYWKNFKEKPLPDDIKPLGIVRKLKGLGDLKNMKPGDHYEWHGLHFKFFDFAIPEHMDHKSTLGHMRVYWPCVSSQFISQAIFHSRHMITISFLGEGKTGVEREYLTGFLISEPKGSNVYHWALCSGMLKTYKSWVEYGRKQNLVAEIRPSFGLLLQAISATHHKILGKDNIILDATEESFGYYEKLGYTDMGNKRYKMNLTDSNVDDLWNRMKPKFDQLENFLEDVPRGASYKYTLGFSHAYDDNNNKRYPW